MRRATWALGGVAAVIVVVVGLTVTSAAGQASPAAPAAGVATAKVTEGRLSATVSENGTLTYRAEPDGSPYSVVNQAAGTYTELPEPGQEISRGQVLYRVNDSPALLLYGSTPAYRTLSAGVTGADVAELNAELVKLGYATDAELGTSSRVFGSGTTTAVQKFQAAAGMTPSGILALGEVVFEPSALRVTARSVALGGSAQAGQTVLQATSSTRLVQVALDASQQNTVAVGDTVSITLPDNRITAGVVSSVGAVATCPSSAGQGTAGSASPTTGTDTCSTNSGSTDPTVNVYVTPSDLSVTGTWDQAPVQVGITTASVESALAVPVTALLARSGGGYAVEVVAAAAHRLVPVTLGLFDDAAGLVQVTGSGLAAGQDVVVPST